MCVYSVPDDPNSRETAQEEKQRETADNQKQRE